MSQFGMQMPAGRMRRGPALDLFTGLAGAACISLAIACVFMFFALKSVAPQGDITRLQEIGKVEFQAAPPSK